MPTATYSRTALPQPARDRICWGGGVRSHFVYCQSTCTTTLGHIKATTPPSLPNPEAAGLAEASQLGRQKHFFLGELILAMPKRNHQGREAGWLCCPS